MTVSDSQRNEPGADAAERRRLDDELIGLDRDDPEVQAFAEHLERTHRQRPGYTVEGYLSGVADFADSVTGAGGGRRLVGIGVVALLLLGAVFAVWEALVFVFSTFAGAGM
ncbi:MAG TPA: hypothetical protein VE709_12675 [Pseudonocardiaceae bacterium]|nr:hypothetical protein [Pseudonocardiaceae bacterium]